MGASTITNFFNEKEALEKAVKKIVPNAADRCTMLEGFERGGYAKHPAKLLHHMNQLFETT